MGMICITVIVSALIVCFGPDYAIRNVESFLNHQLDANIDVQKISVNIWKQEINLHHVQMISNNQTPVAGCQKLSLSIALSSIWSDNIQVNHLHMNRPWLYFPIDSNRPINFQQVLPFFSFINQLMKKRIFSIRDMQRKKTLFLKSLALFDGTLFFSQSANEKSFRLKQFMIKASKDQLNLAGLLSYADPQGADLQLLRFNTSGQYSTDHLAQAIMMLLSSQSPDLFNERLMDIVENLRFQSNGDIQLSNALFGQIEQLDKKISGNIVGSFDLNALSDFPSMQVSIDFSGEHIANIPITKLLLQANFEERLITINEIALKTRDSQVNIQGIIDLKKIFTHNFLKPNKNWEKINWHFIVNSDHFPLYHFHPAIPKFSRFNGKLTLKGQGIDVESFLSDIQIDGHVQIPQKYSLKPETSLKYTVDVHAESDMLTVSALTAQTEGMVLTAHGHMNQQMMGKLSINTLISGKWLSLFGLPELSSDFHTALTLQRSKTETTAHMQLIGHQLALNQYQLGDFKCEANYLAPGQVEIKKMSLSQLSSEIETSGFFNWKDDFKIGTSLPESYDISIHSNNMQLHDIYPGLSGNIKIDGNIVGSKKNLSGQISLDGDSLILFGQRIKSLHCPIQLSYDDIQIPSGNIQIADNEHINIEFALNRDKNYQINIHSNPIDVSHLNGLIPELKGQFKVDMNGKGHVNQPQLEGNVTVSPIFFQNKPLPDAVFKIKTVDDTLFIDCQSMLDFHAQYHIKKRYIDMHAKATNMQLAPVLASFGYSQFNGQVSGSFQMASQLHNFLNAQGRLQIDHAALTYNSFPLAWMDHFELMIENKELTASNYMIHLPQGGFCRGTVYGKFPEQTHLQIDSTVALSVLQNLTDNISDIAGNLNIKGTLHRLLNGSKFTGHINLTDGELISTWNNQRIHHVKGQMKVKDHMVTIKQFSFGIDEGKCDLKGKMIFNNHQLNQIDLKAEASAIPIYIPNTSDLMFNAKLNFSKRNQHGRLTGNVEFLEGLYYHDLSINQMLLARLQQKHRANIVDQLCKFFPPICRTDLEISIQSRLPLIVDNDLAYMEIHPDLSVRGTIYNPVILGRTEMLSGEINYLGKTFVLEKGVIDFVNPYRTDPMIDIKSNVTIRDWLISLDVIGKPDELQVKLGSTPTEAHEDIISILLFGKPTKQLFVPNDTGPYKSTQQMIAELLSSAFEDDIKNTTGLDTFRLEAYEHETVDDNQRDDYKITLGKELSRRMSVTYAFETRKGQLIHHTQANYKILENLIFRGMQDTQGTYGGELLLRMEFRQIPGF